MDAWEVDCPKCNAPAGETEAEHCKENGRLYVMSHKTGRAKAGEKLTFRMRYDAAYHPERVIRAKNVSRPDDCCFCGQGWNNHVLEACFLVGDMPLPEDVTEVRWGWEGPVL